METGLTTSQSVLGAMLVAVLLAGLHLAAPRLRTLPFVPERATGSFAGGLAVSYVFLHLLPEIAEGNEAAGESEPPALVYRLHLGSFMVYNVLITYNMPLRLRTGVAFAVLFTVAMGLHFVLTDRGLEEHYPRRFAARGRFELAAVLLLGWALAALVAPSSTLLVALLTALLGGSVLLNVFEEELPEPVRRPARPGHRPGRVDASPRQVTVVFTGAISPLFSPAS